MRGIRVKNDVEVNVHFRPRGQDWPLVDTFTMRHRIRGPEATSSSHSLYLRGPWPPLPPWLTERDRRRSRFGLHRRAVSTRRIRTPIKWSAYRGKGVGRHCQVYSR